MHAAVIAFTRDLRIDDHPGLVAAAARAEHVMPVFVIDDDLIRGPHRAPNRLAYLAEALTDLDRSLRSLGARLVVRRGDWVSEVVGTARDVGAELIVVADDVSAHAGRRTGHLRRAATRERIAVETAPGVTVVPPGALEPAGGGEYKVFTPYHRRWAQTPWGEPLDPPDALRLPPGVRARPTPTVGELTEAPRSPGLVAGGETAAVRRRTRWLADELDTDDEGHDDIAGDRTSHLSAALHFGCISPRRTALLARERGGDAFVRQLCWRDFYHQVLAARPDAAHADYRDRGIEWDDDDDAFAAWTEGRTGYPIVDAGMRQLREAGWMHNRARMIVASFLTKDLAVDWRRGAAHFMDWLVDGDVANNQLNWQWTAGTGTDNNPHRILNPSVQGQRFDPEGTYIRRYVPELADVDAADLHEPGRLIGSLLAPDYPAPIVDHHEAIARYRARRDA